MLPHLGASLVPDELIRSIGKTLQLASRLYELDVPRLRRDRALAHKRSFASSIDLQDQYTPPPTPPEPRFDPDFDEQAKGVIHGTTVEVVEVGRERFAYWSLDLLFSLCTDQDQGESRDEAFSCLQEADPSPSRFTDHETERRRIAALCLPSLITRCASTIKTYVADAPLRGKMPFPR